MKTIFTSTVLILLFSLSVSAQQPRNRYTLKPDTVMKYKKFNPVTIYMQSLVKKPVYSNNNPAPVKLPNAYIKSADHSVPIPTHRVLVDSIRFTPKQ